MKKPLPQVKIPAELQDRLCAEGDAFHFEELMTAQPEATQAYFRARLAARRPVAKEGE